ncbi:MAG: Gfo/Idh/MocA family oxidoreductase [Candidatus Harrisonbacteria bacterium]|nr:Gfo/Idh/MocA family oxidoreductase [Candidatus Harrisonbacteria bacterium]
MKNYILVGLGPHAKRIYYPFLEKHQAKYDIRLKLLIELESQSSRVMEFLRQRSLQPGKILYISDSESNRMGAELDGAVKKELDGIVRQERIDGIIISTEPKAHKIYAEWALKNNVNILMDKPITSPLYPSTKIESAHQIYQDYLDLRELHEQSRSKFYIVCQRRNHQGYVLIKKYLKDFVSEYEIPISYIDIYHADGAWSLPHEFQKENHPYKYGYGKLMHSGYHFVDLFAWLAQANFGLENARPDLAKVYTARFTPNDFFHQIPETAYAKFFNRPATRDFYRAYKPQDYKHFGELDAYILTQLMRGQNVVTSGSINLQQNSFSRRGWFDLPEDTYKGNGRVRHERVNIQVSQFLNIQAHSYQSYEPSKDATEIGSLGSEDHFDIFIFRNKKMVGGKPFLKISVGGEMEENHKKDSYYLGHNEQAREITLLNFIEGKPDESEFQYHDFTNQLLSNIYASIAQGAQTGNQQLTFKI